MSAYFDSYLSLKKCTLGPRKNQNLVSHEAWKKRLGWRWGQNVWPDNWLGLWKEYKWVGWLVACHSDKPWDTLVVSFYPATEKSQLTVTQVTVSSVIGRSRMRMLGGRRRREREWAREREEGEKWMRCLRCRCAPSILEAHGWREKYWKWRNVAPLLQEDALSCATWALLLPSVTPLRLLTWSRFTRLQLE